MSNGLSADNKSEFLFKNYLRFPTNIPNSLFFNEQNVKFNDYIQAENIFLQNIPDDPDFDISNSLGNSRYPNQIFKNYYIDKNDVLEKFEELELQEVPNSNGKSFTAFVGGDDTNLKTILTDAFQYNYGQNNKFAYELYTSDGTFIDLTNTNYNYIFDIKSGYITFFGDNLVGVSSSSPPKLTFVRYRGAKSLNFSGI